MNRNKWLKTAALMALVMLPGLALAEWTYKQRGFSILPTTQESWSSENFKQTVRNMRSMGINLVTLRITRSQETMTSHEFMTYDRSASDQSLNDAITFIKSQGLKFALHLVVNPPEWRANINPTDREAWFRSMGNFAIKYARDFAAPFGADHLSVGTEMYGVVSNVHNPDNADEKAGQPERYRWPDIIADIKRYYDGTITYSAQHTSIDSTNPNDRSSLFHDNDLIPNIDVLGLSAYFPLFSETEEGLEREWTRIERDTLVPAINRYQKRIALAEIGYRPCEFTLRAPYASDAECGAFRGDFQALGWKALLSYFSEKEWMDGIIGGWLWNEDPNVGGEQDFDYTPWDKPAADVFRDKDNENVFWPVVPLPTTEPPPVDPPAALRESQYSGVPF